MLTVRKMEWADVDILAQIQKDAFTPLYQKFHDPSNPHLRGREDIERRLDNPCIHPFTIEEDGCIVGGIWYIRNRKLLLCELKPHEYYLGRVFIRPDRQGKGLAKQAILLCEQQFPDAVKYYVDFPDVLEKNRRCYAGAGYRPTGIKQETDPGVILELYEKIVKQP